MAFRCKLFIVVAMFGVALAGDINRQAIIFYPETPDLFYCPQEKPISLAGMLVKAKPLKKLCEYEGRPLPQVKCKCKQKVTEMQLLGLGLTVKRVTFLSCT